MSLSNRVLSDLQAQHQRLLDEFEDWRDRASGSGDLPQHHTQIERTTHQLEGFLGAVVEGTALGPAGNAASAELDDVMGLRRNLGTVHLVWDFFRDKFAQRDTGLFTDHLGAADDLALACYEPFVKATLEAAAPPVDEEVFDGTSRGIPDAVLRDLAPVESMRPEQLKESPLLFYSSDRSPFAQARASAFRPPGLSPRDVEMFRQMLHHLPVPVIGMPWAQARSLPSLVFVGHEAGHVVAEDLGLVDAFADLIAGLGLPEERTRVWTSWVDEAFADVFGVVATGSAYVERMVRILADDVATVRNQQIDRDKPGPYPTFSLRVGLCQKVQELLGLTVDPSWRKTYGSPTGDAFRYGADLEGVATALLHGPYPTLGDRGLADILPWGPTDDLNAEESAQEILAGDDAPVSFSVRLWVAAAVQAQKQEPSRYLQDDLDQRFAREIVEARDEGTRAEVGVALRSSLPGFDGGALGLESFGAPSPSMADLDRQMGAQMMALLQRHHDNPSSD